MRNSHNNLKEQLIRMKSLFSEERLYGNLVEQAKLEGVDIGALVTGGFANQAEGDKFRNWVHANPKKLAVVNAAITAEGLAGILDKPKKGKTASFNNKWVKVALGAVQDDYKAVLDAPPKVVKSKKPVIGKIYTDAEIAEIAKNGFATDAEAKQFTDWAITQKDDAMGVYKYGEDGEPICIEDGKFDVCHPHIMLQSMIGVAFPDAHSEDDIRSSLQGAAKDSPQMKTAAEGILGNYSEYLAYLKSKAEEEDKPVVTKGDEKPKGGEITKFEDIDVADLSTEVTDQLIRNQLGKDIKFSPKDFYDEIVSLDAAGVATQEIKGELIKFLNTGQVIVPPITIGKMVVVKVPDDGKRGEYYYEKTDEAGEVVLPVYGSDKKITPYLITLTDGVPSGGLTYDKTKNSITGVLPTTDIVNTTTFEEIIPGARTAPQKGALKALVKQMETAKGNELGLLKRNGQKCFTELKLYSKAAKEGVNIEKWAETQNEDPAVAREYVETCMSKFGNEKKIKNHAAIQKMIREEGIEYDVGSDSGKIPIKSDSGVVLGYIKKIRGQTNLFGARGKGNYYFLTHNRQIPERKRDAILKALNDAGIPATRIKKEGRGWNKYRDRFNFRVYDA